jgi:hypothetical protein
MGGAGGWTADEITQRFYHNESETLSVDCYSLAVNCTFAETGMNHGSATETNPK